MKLGFSVLHYQLSEVTINCVNSILKNIDDVEIVVVDNCSPNSSGLFLEKLFESFTNVKCIKTKTNLGFAKGNNLGYLYLKSIGCDYICCINNDILITQSNFKNILQDEFKKKSFCSLCSQSYSSR
ncbi:glycosyltransferase [Streptococcus uberis]|uniref:glycosyltransferase n=1 Tax=Streptococcus uberis TaxID=1349 RepID=UPI001FF15D33|nr:glycosyltransferase [Streptococcus uberis]MCK1159026.1 glycosyltransferase [Streptococcus uberis]MCK1214601.1 glycosyltransferase [Streptococcus uberis]